MRVYADPSNLADWLGLDQPPPNAERRLRAASLAVDEMLLTAVYHVDDEGHPEDPDQRQALQDATCAQAEYAADTGDPYGTGGQTYSEAQIGSVRLVRTTAPPANLPERHAPQALSILQQHGLTGHPVQERGVTSGPARLPAGA